MKDKQPKKEKLLTWTQAERLLGKQIQPRTIPASLFMSVARNFWTSGKKVEKLPVEALGVTGPQTITWRKALSELHRKDAVLDGDTMPAKLAVALALGHWRRPELSSRNKGKFKECRVCGTARRDNPSAMCDGCRKRERERFRWTIYQGNKHVSRLVKIQCALTEFGMSPVDIALMLGTTLAEVERAKRARRQWRDRTEQERQDARELVAAVRQIYAGNQFPLVSSGPAGEIRLGRANKWTKIPTGVVVVTDAELELLRRLVVNPMDAVRTNTRRYKLQSKFGVNDLDGLIAKAEELGLSAD